MMSRFGKITVFVVFLTFLSGYVYAADKKDAYAIENVPITVSAANPAAARDTAIEDAQIKAFERLAQKILPAAASDTAAMLDKKIIFSFVRDFSVKNERNSATEYRAVFTVRFYEDKVKRFFAEKGVTVNEIKEIRILVVPILQVGQRGVIWDDPNPWADAWKQADLGTDERITFAVPVGDIPDVRSIPDTGVFANITDSAAAFKEITDRYGADELIFATAVSKGAAMDAGQGVKVSLYIFNRKTVSIDTLDPLDIGPDATGFGTAVKAVISGLRDNPKAVMTETGTSASGTGNPDETGADASAATDGLPAVTVRFPIRTLRDWIVMKDKLSGISAISDVQVMQMNKSYVDITVRHTGTVDELNTDLDRCCGAALVPSNGYGSGSSYSDPNPLPQYILQVPETGFSAYRPY